MAKETKQDRVARLILDQVTEHMHELKSLESMSNAKESDVEKWAQSFLKSCLGYVSSAGYSIRSQESKGKMRPDLIVLKDDKPIFVVEIKRFGFDLKKSDLRSGKLQLNEYLQQIGNVRWGVLTNGIEWKLFDFAQPQYNGIEVAAFDLKADHDTIDLTKKVIEEQCYDLLDFHETAYAASAWSDLSKEATAFSPESLAKAILSADTVKYVARMIKGEHEFKANHDVLTDRIYWLLEHGLKEVVSGWNESRATELHKFIKAQKRAARKVKSVRKSHQSEHVELGTTRSLDDESTVLIVSDEKKSA